MEIRVLRYFLTVVREEGINRAAEALHITQPTLSRQLFQLEREVGVKLFNRGAKKITLTNEGILLRRRAEEILALVDRTEQELIEQDEQVEGRVVIGGGELAAMQELPKIISSFREKYPLVTFDIFTGNADVVKEQMEKGLIDIGVLLEPIDIEKFDFIRLKGKEQWGVLMRPDDPIAEKEVITAKDLENTSLILPRRNNVQNELTNWLGDSFQESHKYKWCFDGSKWFGIFSCNRRFSSIFGQRENYLSSSISAAHLKQCAGVEKTTAVLSCGNKIY